MGAARVKSCDQLRIAADLPLILRSATTAALIIMYVDCGGLSNRPARITRIPCSGAGDWGGRCRAKAAGVWYPMARADGRSCSRSCQPRPDRGHSRLRHPGRWHSGKPCRQGQKARHPGHDVRVGGAGPVISRSAQPLLWMMTKAPAMWLRQSTLAGRHHACIHHQRLTGHRAAGV